MKKVVMDCGGCSRKKCSGCPTAKSSREEISRFKNPGNGSWKRGRRWTPFFKKYATIAMLCMASANTVYIR
jgi:hypothetical protein